MKRPPFPRDVDQASVAQLREMERQGRASDTELVAQLAWTEASSTGLNQRPEHGQAVFLRQGGQRSDGRL